MIGGDARKTLTAAKVRAVLIRNGMKECRSEQTTGFLVDDSRGFPLVEFFPPLHGDLEYKRRWAEEETGRALRILEREGVDAVTVRGMVCCRGYLSPPESEESSR